MKGKQEKEGEKKLADRKGQRPALPFDREKDSAKNLLQRVRKKHAFEEPKKAKDKNDELSRIWDEDLCE